MYITTLLNRQAEIVVAEAHKGMLILSLLQVSQAVVAVGLLLNLVAVVGNACDTAILGILVLFELATAEELLEHTTGTVALVGTLLYVGALLAHHMPVASSSKW